MEERNLLIQRSHQILSKIEKIVSSDLVEPEFDSLYKLVNILADIESLWQEDFTEIAFPFYELSLIKKQEKINELTAYIESLELIVAKETLFPSNTKTVEPILDLLIKVRRELCFRYNTKIPSTIFDQAEIKQKKITMKPIPKTKPLSTAFPSSEFKLKKLSPSFGYMALQNGAETTIVPSAYIGVNQRQFKSSIAYLRGNYPHLVIEKRVGKYNKHSSCWDIELKLTNCNFRDLFELKQIPWDTIDETSIVDLSYYPNLSEREELGRTDNLVCYSYDHEFAIVIAFSNKSTLSKWFNFLKRGKGITGDSSFLASGLANIQINLSESKRLFSKFKHQLWIVGLTIEQLQLTTQFDYSQPPQSEDYGIFDMGEFLSAKEMASYVAHTTLQANY